MKKSLTIALAAILCAATLCAQYPAPQVAIENPAQPTQQIGVETIAAIRKAYEKGEYDTFLKEAEKDYQKAKEEDELSGLADFRMGPASPQWIDLEKAIRKERSQELLSLISKQGESPLAQKIRSATTEFSPEVEEAFTKLSAFHYMAPGSGKNNDENQLIDLDLAYEYKALHLDLPLAEGQPLPDRREKHYVLKMQKMDQMVKISEDFEDASLKEAIILATTHLDTRLAQNWDLTDLNALAKGRIQPSSKLEEKAAALLNNSQDKFTELSKELVEKQ